MSPVSGYTPIPGAYDELLDSRGMPREKYKFILNSYDEIGEAELAQRRKELTRLLKENGVTYNVYGSGDEKKRLWSLDLMPFLMESAEFSALERGLIQRGELLNALFKDLYGPRRLLFDKIVPPEVVYAAQGYLRPCFGFYQQRERELLFFSSDLARRADGTFVVIGDRAQAPSGTGYALENRIVLSRVFPSLYRDSEVHRVAMFFRTLRKSLIAQVRNSTNREPLVVLLTPGPGNETYFEHVFLAGYLGYTLAQATDLTVRNNRVYIKTVEGHQQVDVILRRTDDIFMDPLELRGDSLLGVPGILEAIRNGNVAVVNPLGSAVLENRSLTAYFPQLCKFYFGESLILPDTETYYMGDEEHRRIVLADLNRFVIKPTARNIVGQRHNYPANMSWVDREAFLMRLNAAPQNYIAQEIVPGSSIPVLNSDNQMVAGKCVIRTFQVASDSGYQVMPGGLARVSTRTDELIITNQSGAGSKDIWILASEPQKDVSLLREVSPESRISRKATGSVPSRIADNIYWMARYAERAENLSRLLKHVIAKVTQIEDFSSPEDIAKLLKMVTHVTGEYPGFIGDDAAELIQHPENELRRLIYDAATGGSVRYNVLSLIRASQNLRDNLSDDMRRVISQLEAEPYASTVFSIQHAHLFDVVIYLSSIAGLSQENMSREVGWHFLELGRRIERAAFTLRVLKSFVSLGNLYDKFIVENLLSINDIRITYTRRYGHRIETDSVLDILLFDETNPRSLGYQLVKIQEYVPILPTKTEGARPVTEKISLKLFTAYRTTDIREIFAHENPSAELTPWLNELGEYLGELGRTLADTYFTYVEEQYRIGEMDGQ
jgi:uncharacterized circularly permuted ATP-grasp superfamily protein/uncharacterized alpha-E superfamily protein